MARSKAREVIISDRNAVKQLRNLLYHVDEMAKDSGAYIWKMEDGCYGSKTRYKSAD